MRVIPNAPWSEIFSVALNLAETAIPLLEAVWGEVSTHDTDGLNSLLRISEVVEVIMSGLKSPDSNIEFFL